MDIQKDFFGRNVRTGHGVAPTCFQTSIFSAITTNWMVTMLKKKCSEELADKTLLLALETTSLGGPFVNFRGRDDLEFAHNEIEKAQARLDAWQNNPIDIRPSWYSLERNG